LLSLVFHRVLDSTAVAGSVNRHVVAELEQIGRLIENECIVAAASGLYVALTLKVGEAEIASVKRDVRILSRDCAEVGASRQHIV
jgi:hypothetical protein